MRNAKRTLTTTFTVTAGLIAGYGTRLLVAHADQNHAKPTVSIADLAKMKGPRPPSSATYAGIEAQPMVGELELPLRDAQVYLFSVKTQNGNVVPVKWSYSPAGGTYMWTTAPILCEDNKTTARGGFVMEVRQDGSGSYALGTRQCPTSGVYGCNFNSHQQETACGACVWNGTELVCAKNQP